VPDPAPHRRRRHWIPWPNRRDSQDPWRPIRRPRRGVPRGRVRTSEPLPATSPSACSRHSREETRCPTHRRPREGWECRGRAGLPANKRPRQSKDGVLGIFEFVLALVFITTARRIVQRRLSHPRRGESLQVGTEELHRIRETIAGASSAWRRSGTSTRTSWSREKLAASSRPGTRGTSVSASRGQAVYPQWNTLGPLEIRTTNLSWPPQRDPAKGRLTTPELGPSKETEVGQGSRQRPSPRPTENAMNPVGGYEQ
jgi:hypothetical protein